MTTPIEFERKFLVRKDRVADIVAAASRHMRIDQGYFMDDANRCVRVRSVGADYFLTFKVATGEVGKARETEFSIPAENAMQVLADCVKGVSKTRHIVKVAGFTWEVDVFLGHNEGLVLAEVELDSDEASERLSMVLPDWVEREVTGDPAYFNTALAVRPANG